MEFNDIVQLIDNGEFREADGQIKKWRLKYPTNSAFICLLHYSSYKQGSNTALVNAREFAKKQTLNDANAVLVLYRIFSQEGLMKEAQQIYESSLRKYPILGSKLLPALIEEMINGITPIDIKELEKLLMQLQKNSGDAKDVYNAAFACSLIADDSAKLMNQLGLKLVEKLPLENTQQLYVIAKLNSNLNQWEAIINKVDTFKGSTEVELDLEIDALYVNALINSENWQKLHDHTFPKLTTFNDYTTILNFILAMRNLNKSHGQIKLVLDSIPFKRNRELSYVELAIQFSVPHEAFLQQYYDNLKSKLCCFYDISHYPNLESIKLDETSNDIHVEINNQKFKLLNLEGDQKSFMDESEAIYQRSRESTTLERYETLPANELILMNLQINQALSPFERTERINDLLTHNTDDPRVRMWMMHNLSQFGHFSQSVLHHFKLLKIKMIQIDTLGYFINNLVPLKQNLTDLLNLYRYYLTIPSENISMVMGGIEKQVYTKLEGFFSFYNKCLNSVGELQLSLNIVQMTTILGMPDYLTFVLDRVRNRFQLDLLNDNRDFKTLWKFGINTKEPEAPTDMLALKLDYYKALLLYERSSEKAHSHIKNFNKLLSGDLKSLNKFQIWLYRIYFNLFKYLHKYNQKEMVTNLNYLTKNLKFSKVSPILNEFLVLSTDYTLLMVSLVELAHNLTGLSVVKSQRLLLVTDLKKLSIKSLVTAELQKAGASNFGFADTMDNYDILITSLK